MPETAQSLTWVLGLLYLLPLVLIFLLVKRRPLRETETPTVGWILLTFLVIPVLALVIGGLSYRGAFWLCNCGSFYLYNGNNHFDEDVLFAHAVSGPLLSTVYLHAFWFKRVGGPPLALPTHVVITSWALLILWAGTVTWIAPGCR